MLLDLALPDSSGFDTFARVRTQAPDVAIILLTGLDDEELAVAAMRDGAQDYLVKGRVDGGLLTRSIVYAIERKRAAEALRESEEKLRLALEASESGIWDYDVRSGKITSSPGCQAMLGYEALEVIDSLDAAWSSMIHPDDRQVSLEAFHDVLSGAAPYYERDHRLRAADGSWVWVHGRGRVVERSEDGTALRLIITRTNITARKAAEHAALENARLFEQQRHIATTLQESFIHPLPTVAGLELGVVSKAAYEPDLVGGDFSDVFVIDDTHVVVLIGDVGGKGVRAAGHTETVRSEMRTLASIDPSPAFILGKTNELLLRFDPDEPLVTAFLAVLDPHSGQLTYGSAGHPAPIHLDASDCRLLEVDYGPPLGSFDRPYTSAHAMLSPEATLVLYTDGVTEARRGDEFFGEAGLLEVVSGLRGRSAQVMAEGVRDAAIAFAGRLRDDLQVVVLRLA